MRMKKLLKDKAGVTVLEGIIALGLLALIAGGAFGVLLAASRQASQPDIREEMAWAVENANARLKMRAAALCPDDSAPLALGNHNIKCLLPPLCDQNRSEFIYGVEKCSPEEACEYRFTFNIRCNGYEL